MKQHPFRGTHIFGEMYGVDLAKLNDVDALTQAFKRGIERSGANLCHLQVQSFEPYGTTLLALLSESHASIHTYPEFQSLFFDAFTCGDLCKPHEIAKSIAELLQPQQEKYKTMIRGVPTDDSITHSRA